MKITFSAREAERDRQFDALTKEVEALRAHVASAAGATTAHANHAPVYMAAAAAPAAAAQPAQRPPPVSFPQPLAHSLNFSNLSADASADLTAVHGLSTVSPLPHRVCLVLVCRGCCHLIFPTHSKTCRLLRLSQLLPIRSFPRSTPGVRFWHSTQPASSLASGATRPLSRRWAEPGTCTTPPRALPLRSTWRTCPSTRISFQHSRRTERRRRQCRSPLRQATPRLSPSAAGRIRSRALP